ncbi:hypothetical protein PPL_06533 [Heterostelium album PN500]|uniref:FNIP repeat-containing protein n=1 Tax=Heterostelium pallidum (strain ATCC 26659 / Pp 5 / PN500) TaxID=670386 RepID=D3BDF0_HETP5|nr:hypothetical protein PPL_06533 [Heterostelium album PN500]EFA80594.1 hypothetical protein PPL_06533 [Heterostelium album PN500]|eukprot:XP_020432714.1 hypothetical protein PPL_06533 [Heterostelium album PN500]
MIICKNNIFSCSNNDNQTNKLVNISYLLLAKVINYLDDNIDRIVDFSLKTKCKAVVGDEFFKYKYDYLISKDELDDIDRLKTLNIDKVSIGLNDNEDNKENIKNLYRLISHLNISKLKCVQSCSGLPMNITSISFIYSFREEIVPGCLPPNLKTLKFGRYFNQPIEPGVLPNTLIKLIFNESFNQPLEPGVLPSSLKVLKFKESNFNQDIKVGTFPPNLEVLEFHRSYSTLEDGALPQTLRILEYAPTSWLPQIKTLPNLETLIIGDASNDPHIDLNYLPVSLTRLEIFLNIKLINVMPPTIRYLNLENCLVEEIPFGVDTLSIQFASTFQKEIPSSVKKLVIFKDIFCIKDLQKRYDMTGAASIQELVIICDELADSHRISVYIPPIIFPPKTLIEIPDIRNEKIWIRMIDNQYYLVLSQSPIITSIVHVSKLHKYIIYIINEYEQTL